MLWTADQRRYRTHRTALMALLLAALLLVLLACRANSHRDVRINDAAHPAEAPSPAAELAPASTPGRGKPTDHFLQQEAESMAREDQGRAADALEQEAKNAPPPKPRRSPLRQTGRPLPMRRRP